MEPVLGVTNVTDPGSFVSQASDLVTSNIAAIGAAALAIVGLGFGYRWFRRVTKG